jgi:2-polyprenyl-3-methyl-5-hydroxy-6-metoxy-1,4-benzoquinol methylase
MLAQESFSVTACDVEFSPLHLVQKKIDFPNDIDFIEGDILDMELPKNSFDIIFALDVLEHIDSIETYIVLFEKLLKPDGVIVVLGPTENVLYKIGRKIAGSRFQGDYHVTNISLIKASFKKLLTVSTLKKLVFPIVLFEMFTATKKKIEAE